MKYCKDCKYFLLSENGKSGYCISEKSQKKNKHFVFQHDKICKAFNEKAK